MGQKNFKRIPPKIAAKLSMLEVDDIIVATAKVITPNEIAHYANLGLRLANGQLQVSRPWLPLTTAGRYSHANLNGRTIVRRDLPKEERSYSWDTPIFGDYSKGTYTHYATRKVYPRELLPPKGVTMSAELIRTNEDGSFTVKFAVDEPLNKHSSRFEDDLLYNLNILQENLGSVDLFRLTATLADFQATVHLDWQILPPEEVPELVRRMLQGKQAVSEETRRIMVERIGVLASLHPLNYIAGSDDFLRYFGAQFGEDFVAFENAYYGNAIYVMYANWRELSQRSRIDLLKGSRDGFARIEHRAHWEDRLRARVRDYRNLNPTSATYAEN